MNCQGPVTRSEALLTRLCRKTFLHLWSYPNLFRDQGKAQTGEGKELCDLLVVFGEDVLVFSDKDCELKRHADPRVAWRRWYRDAVLASAKQIVGAERWLREHPDRVFLNRRCSEPFPIELPKNPRIHRLVTCRGAAVACKAALGGSGSLLVSNMPLSECSEEPFRLGCFDDGSRMYHVLDEVALEALMTTLDTVSDFCAYLTKREALFRKGHMVLAAGEEQLLAFYMRGLSADGQGHEFEVPKDMQGVFVDESFWNWWQGSNERVAKRAADEISYCWDRLIEKFSYHMVMGTQEFATERDLRIQEVIVRWMARESRFRRRILAEGLLGAMRNVNVGQMRRRYLPPGGQGEPFWIFVAFPRPDGMEYGRYRELRRELLLEHCCAIKFIHPDAKDVVAIGVEPRLKEISEDAIYMDARAWNSELQAKGKYAHEVQGFFCAPTRIERRVWEYPV